MNNQQLWQSVLGNMEVSISRGNFNTWFKNTAIVDRQGETITIGVPSIFIRKWISEKFHPELLKMLKQLAPEIREIKYQVGQNRVSNQGTEAPASAPRATQQAPNYSTPTASAPGRQQSLSSGGLNTKYLFETFVIGKHNELAHAASLAVAKNPGSQYNPLFIYGGVGLGKTHLMHAVGNRQMQENQDYRVLYVTSEKFTNDYISAISHKRMDDFKKTYRSVDMLLIDDIQFIAGKEGTQEEFFHTFNELRDKGKQIILTADRLPKEIPSIEQRLVSRFEWGMVADIQAPDLETRMAILQNKINKKGVSFSDEVLYYIAENIVTNIRELEGALNRLVISQQMESHPITVEHAKQILVNMLTAKKKVLSLKRIALSVAEFYHITLEDLLKQSRRKEYVKPRQVAMFMARKELSSSFPIIGEFFGGRDHTTVMHGVEKIDKAVNGNEPVKQDIEMIMEKLYAV